MVGTSIAAASAAASVSLPLAISAMAPSSAIAGAVDGEARDLAQHHAGVDDEEDREDDGIHEPPTPPRA